MICALGEALGARRAHAAKCRVARTSETRRDATATATAFERNGHEFSK